MRIGEIVELRRLGVDDMSDVRIRPEGNVEIYARDERAGEALAHRLVVTLGKSTTLYVGLPAPDDGFTNEERYQLLS
jgi:hypothetical protein